MLMIRVHKHTHTHSLGTVNGLLMAAFLDNVGGAWDNAKKFIELGHHGGKNSEAHKASVTGRSERSQTLPNLTIWLFYK